ncbi:MAG: ATP-dependent Clp protease ATP-binding subunit [Candidatus Paceibacterota bacterium]|jgi:ATP-dependent Clp protease ATP-binding subunit ClpA
MINLKKTDMCDVAKIEVLFWCFRLIQKISFVLLTIFIILYAYNIYAGKASGQILGASILFFSTLLLMKNLTSLFDEYLKTPKIKIALKEALDDKKINLASFLNLKSVKYLGAAIKESKKNGLRYPNPQTILFNFIDVKNPKIIFIFSRLLIDYVGLKNQLKNNPSLNQITRENFEGIIEEAGMIALKRNGEDIREGDIIASLAKIEPNLAEIITQSDIDTDDFEKVNEWQERVYKKIQKDKCFWSYENLLKAGSIGRDWASGYTPTLDNFSIDWTDEIKRRGFEEIVGHQAQVSQVEMILSKKDAGNVLIVGDPGVGRKNIIHGVIRKSLFNQSAPNINNNRFIELNIVSLSSNVTSFEQMERILEQCFREVAHAGNVILIINDFHDFLGGAKKAGIVDISGTIGPYLNMPSFKTICLTSFNGLHKYIESKSSLLAQFQKIEVEEMNKEETLQILENKVFRLENEYEKFIPFNSLKEIYNISEKYVSNFPFPQKAINLLEETAIYSGRYVDTQIVLPEHVDKILSEKIQIPIGKIKSKEKETLLNLENILHKRIVGQFEAIKEISSALRRARSGVQTRKGPMGSFLFLGPTGVGKTETAKALAETYFSSEEKMIRIDMSEFQRIDDIPRLLGSETQEGILTTAVRENPFSLILLDEIEKAHPDILNVFLQVLDEGYVNDNLGRKVSFLNTIIIATSNAGYQTILKAIEENKEMGEIKKELLNAIFEKGTFRPEFINRFDGAIIFKSLSKEDLIAIAELQLEKLNKNLLQKKIQFIITEELKDKIVELSYNPVFGAREMKRVIQDKIENTVARAILNDSVPQGSKIQINPKNFEIIIS